MVKLLLIPNQVCIYFFIFGHVFARRTLAALAVIIVGVGVATRAELQVNTDGLVAAAVAVAIVPVEQISFSTFQKRFGVSPVQLNEQISWIRAATSLLFSLWLEPGKIADLLTQPREQGFWMTLLGSCVSAVGVNICTLAILGRTSAISFQVLGNVKTCIILLISHANSSRQMSFAELVGVAVALLGAWYYSRTRDTL